MDALSPEAMLTFYRRLYPFKSVYDWLNHDQMPTRLWTHREFAFTLAGDVYVRYKSYNSAEELKTDVCKLNPSRFEIGPVYSGRPRDKKTLRKLTPLQRELVFDIDMTDYDEIRTCCSDANICRLCWKWIAAAVQVLDDAIRDQYGYEQLLWVYSGRRGIHLWISDQEALELTDQQRKSIVGWMAAVFAVKEGTKRPSIRTANKGLPPPLTAALEKLLPYFSEMILEEQECFGSEEGYEKLLGFIPDSKVVDALRSKWSADPSRPSSSKWTDLKAQIRVYDKTNPIRAQLMAAMEDIILYYTYPRIDAEVSKHRNHLLKAPFCIHPKTGRVCVPVDPHTIDKFDPEKVPTIGQLLGELDQLIPVDGQENQPESDVQRTSLQPFVEMLDKHAKTLMDVKRRQKQDPDVLSW